MADLTPTTENYLETIHDLIRDHGTARVRDIAEESKVAPSTVSCALRALARRDLVNYQPYQSVTLTPEGRRIAVRTRRRHELIRRFIREVLRVSDETASQDACRLEHGISVETVDRLSSLMEFLDRCPHARPRWLTKFHAFCETGGQEEPACQCCDGTDSCLDSVSID